MTRSAAWTHNQVEERVRSAMSAAMRADSGAIDMALVREERLDSHSRAFAREARSLVLACAASLTRVLAAHRPGKDAYGNEICRGCGTSDCRMLHGILDVLAAYAVRPVTVDRAEAWRRADAWFGTHAGRVPLAIEEFEDGFSARPVADDRQEAGRLLVVDRHTGSLSLWPLLPGDVLKDQYRRYRNGLC